MGERKSGPGIWVGSIAVIAIAIAGWITFTRIEVLSTAAGWVHHTEQVRFTLQGILSSLQGVESATRGFVITRDEDILQPSGPAHERLESNLSSLRGLVADNATQVARARELERLVRFRLNTQQLEKFVSS